MKTNNLSSEAVKFLSLTAAIIITCVLVWFGFYSMNIGKSIGSNATSQMEDLNDDLVDSGITMYDGKNDIVGSEIVNFIKKYLGEYGSGETGPYSVTVIQGSTSYTYTDGSYISDIRDFTDERYIDPMAEFSGKVIRNANRVITGITFTKQ